MWDKIRVCMQKICDILELVIAICVGVALIVSVAFFMPSLVKTITSEGSTAQFLVFLAQVFNLVVGIEFMKLLCKPSTDNVIEIVIFLVARHMIMASDSGVDMFLSVLGIAILCCVRKASKIVNKKIISKDRIEEKEKQENEN